MQLRKPRLDGLGLACSIWDPAHGLGPCVGGSLCFCFWAPRLSGGDEYTAQSPRAGGTCAAGRALFSLQVGAAGVLFL